MCIFFIVLVLLPINMRNVNCIDPEGNHLFWIYQAYFKGCVSPCTKIWLFFYSFFLIKMTLNMSNITVASIRPSVEIAGEYNSGIDSSLCSLCWPIGSSHRLTHRFFPQVCISALLFFCSIDPSRIHVLPTVLWSFVICWFF